jgi:protein-S-isoprenylcysteine O-methyltransferase Ste14
VQRLFAVAGGVLFVGSLAYFGVSLVWRFAETGGPWSTAAAARPITIDILLFSAFAVHHSVFARLGLKAWVADRWPGLERSIYVWISSGLFLLVCRLWQPVSGVLWAAGPPASVILGTGQLAAGVFVLAAARRLDVLDLAGLRDAFATTTGPRRRIDSRGPYRLVRHPIYLGWCLLVWLPPTMNGTRLVFAMVSCLYLVLAVPLEERDLRRAFGDEYARYEAKVRWRVIPGVY